MRRRLTQQSRAPYYCCIVASVASAKLVNVMSDGAVLAGDVWIPNGDVLVGVVMIGGSGPSDRTNGGYFEAYRAALVRHGVAGLWYDKRGVGESTGNYLAGDIDDLATDALAAFAHLVRLLGAEVPVGLVGHSEGGWVALGAAARSSEMAFVVTNSCPGMTPGQQDRHAVSEAMHADDVTNTSRDAALALYDSLMAAAVADASWEEAVTIIAAAPGRAVLEEYIGAFEPATWAYWKRTRNHDPLPDHAAMTCPHLAIYGAADPMVPVSDSASAFITSGCNPTRHSAAPVTVHIAPGADHRILRPGHDAPAAEHLAALRSWITTAATRAPRYPRVAHDEWAV
jgi:uncharacterized protein